jgi:hypothetical protein
MAIPLSKAAIHRLTPDARKRLEIADAGQPGLYLLIQPSGHKSWAVRYRVRGRSRKLTLDGFPSVATARKFAREALDAVAKGEDPAIAKKTARRSPTLQMELINSNRSAPLQVERYWLPNDTYIDLAVPSAKIGVPFDKNSPSSASSLSDYEKLTVVQELSKCEPAIRTGSLELLELAIEICRRCDIAPPLWLLPYILKMINKLVRINARAGQSRRQLEIHQIRWATVYHLRVSRKITWEDAYEAAHQELRLTRARGSAETIRASCKWMSRHSLLKSMRERGLVGEVDAFAREQYTNREINLERLVSLEASKC